MIKSKLRRILKENWNEFYKKYRNRIRPNVIAGIKKVIIHITDKNFKMVRYFGLYSRRNKDKDKFIKMIDKKIVQIKNQ